MNTTILNYPGFQSLPKEIKQMLVASEAHYFELPASYHRKRWENGYPQSCGQTAHGALALSSNAEIRKRKTELLLDVLHWAAAYSAEARDELGKSAKEVVDLIKTIEQKLCPTLG